MNNNNQVSLAMNYFKLPDPLVVEANLQTMNEMFQEKKRDILSLQQSFAEKLNNKNTKNLFKDFNNDIQKLQQELETIYQKFKETESLMTSMITSSTTTWKNEEIDVSRLTSEFNLHFQDADFLSGLSTYFLESGLLKNYNLLYSNPCDKDKKYTIKPHQKLLFSMASPTIKGNLLVYHDMGTGKTCGISQCILSMAKYYSKYPPNPPAGILLLLQNLDNKTLYSNEIAKGCYYETLDQELPVMKSNNKNIYTIQIKGHRVFYMEADDKGEVIKFRFNQEEGRKTNSVFLYVKLEKMTNTPRSDYRQNAFFKSIFDVNNGCVPKKGAIIIDEAHNFVNPKNLVTRITNEKNPVLLKYKKGVYQSKVKKIFFTGTPSNDFKNTKYIFDLINLLTPNKFTNSSSYPEGIPWFSEKDYFEKNTLEDGRVQYSFKPGKEKLIRDKIKNIISYFTYRFDTETFPELKTRIKYNTTMEFFESTNKGLELTFNEETKSFEKVGEPEGRPVVYIKVKPTKEKNSFAETKEYTNKIYKHDAIAKILLLNPMIKHFFYMDEATVKRPGVFDFATKILQKKMNQYNPKEKTLILKLGLFWLVKKEDVKEFVPMLSEYILMIKSEIKQKSKKYSRVEICVILEKAENISKSEKPIQFPAGESISITSFDSFLKQKNKSNLQLNARRKFHPKDLFKMIYNSEKNKCGNIIKYVFGTSDSKEGLDLFSTTHVHFLKPPDSIAVFEQALARASRFCSFKYITREKHPHVYTPIIYYNEDFETSKNKEKSNSEEFLVKKIMNQVKTPTELVLDLMKQTSLDCNLHAKKTKQKCNENTLKFDKQETVTKYCVSPFDFSTRNIDTSTFLYPYRKCYELPYYYIPYSSFFSNWDFALLSLLEKSGIEPIPLKTSIVENLKNVFQYFYRKYNISLDGAIASLEMTYFLLLTTSKENKKYAEAIAYILQEKFARLEKTKQKKFQKNSMIESIVDKIYEKGKKFQRIENFKELMNQVENEIKNVGKNLTSIEKNTKSALTKLNKKIKNPPKKLRAGLLRSGKRFGNERNNNLRALKKVDYKKFY